MRHAARSLGFMQHLQEMIDSGISDYDAASRLSKAGKPSLVLHLYQVHAVSYNETLWAIGIIYQKTSSHCKSIFSFCKQVNKVGYNGSK